MINKCHSSFLCSVCWTWMLTEVSRRELFRYHQSQPCLSLPHMKAVNNALSKEVFKEVSCFLSLGV